MYYLQFGLSHSKVEYAGRTIDFIITKYTNCSELLISPQIISITNIVNFTNIYSQIMPFSSAYISL